MVALTFLGIAALTLNGVSASVVSRQVSTTRFACPNQLLIEGLIFPLVRGVVMGQWWQCDYLHDNGDGSSSGTNCFYNSTTQVLTHFPNTPLRVDSNPACPQTAPRAQDQTYLIKTARGISNGLCVSPASDTDGAALVLKTCDYRHGNPLQRYKFNGPAIQVNGSSKCVDVTNGSSADGTKLQVWTCFDGNSNQQFTATGGASFLEVPETHISWNLHPNKCLDDTDGNVVDGNPVQIWECVQLNTNQLWFLEPVTNN